MRLQGSEEGGGQQHPFAPLSLESVTSLCPSEASLPFPSEYSPSYHKDRQTPINTIPKKVA